MSDTNLGDGRQGFRKRLSRRRLLSSVGVGSAALTFGSGSVLGDERDDRPERDGSNHADEPADSSIASRFSELTRGTEWRRVSDDVVDFDTYHPQGMTRVGDHFFVSSVEVLSPTESYEEPKDGYDRTPGDGVGHLFKFTRDGELVDEITLGEGDMYHPGGIDYDGTYIWVPVAEYRPDSYSVIYRVDPEDMGATAIFRYPDHVGGIVHNTDAKTLNGVSWGSRQFYRWRLSQCERVANADEPPEELATENPEHYIDYQDAQYLDDGLMLASGLTNYRPPSGDEFSLGGIDLVDLGSETPVHQIPVQEWTDEGKVVTHNPFFAETHPDGLRFYFLPEDDTSRLFVYEALLS